MKGVPIVKSPQIVFFATLVTIATDEAVSNSVPEVTSVALIQLRGNSTVEVSLNIVFP